jgi:hypothetical protein
MSAMSPAIPTIPLTPYYEAPAGPSTGQRPRLDVPLLLIHPSAWRDCLESSWTGWIARLLLARGAEKETFTLVVQALGTTKWILSGVSRQSLEEEFSEVQDPSGACVFSPLLLLHVGEAMDLPHVRAPREGRAGVPVVIASHLIVSCYVRCGVASRRQGEVMLDEDAVFRA